MPSGGGEEREVGGADRAKEEGGAASRGHGLLTKRRRGGGEREGGRRRRVEVGEEIEAVREEEGRGSARSGTLDRGGDEEIDENICSREPVFFARMLTTQWTVKNAQVGSLPVKFAALRLPPLLSFLRLRRALSRSSKNSSLLQQAALLQQNKLLRTLNNQSVQVILSQP